MKKLILFTLLSVLSLAGFSQNFGRLKIHSGLYDNFVINGPDTSVFGWKVDRFSLGTDNAKSLEFLLNGVHSGLIDSTQNVSNRGGATHFGYRSGQKDVTYGNSFFGYFAGKETTSGTQNVGIGALALADNIIGQYNTAVGQGAMQHVTGGWNTAIGQGSLANNITGKMNTLVGEDSYKDGASGDYNTGMGAAVLLSCTGNYNTVIGNQAGNKLTTGSLNLFIGNYAGHWGNWNQKGFIDVYDRPDSASQLTSSPIVIDFNTVPTSQWITNNANVKVNEGSVLFSGTTGATPASGAGTRLMWIPSKAAFRAGIVSGTQWDAANIGLYSTSLGRNTKSSGTASFSSGYGCESSGNYSYAGNNYNTASGESSTAIGSSNIASGTASYCGGTNSISSAIISFSYGDYLLSNSVNLASFGRYNDTIRCTDKSNWIYSDALFQIGNGEGFENLNNAFEVLKNGKTFIGDSSSTTDAILIVDPTDSTSTFIGTVSVEKSLQVGNDATAASAANVGAIRYRSDSNNSYCEMAMQTGASSYAWVIIKQNTW